jgi:RNA polymerase sigma factor FliA
MSAMIRAAADRHAGTRVAELHERVGSCQAMLRSLAWQVSQTVPAGVEIDDLISEGQVGLLQAARSYDPARGAEFGTYAYWRMRGAMLDWVRSQWWYDGADYHGRRLAGRSLTSLSATGTGEDETPAVERIADPHAVEPSQEVSEAELRDLVRDLIGRLGGRARQILEATLLDDQTLEQAGRLIGVHKGSAQRAQTKAFDELADLLREEGVSEMDGKELRKVVYRRRSTGE